MGGVAELNGEFAAVAVKSDVQPPTLIHWENSIPPCDTIHQATLRYAQRGSRFGRSVRLRPIAFGIRDWLLREC